ncbi:MAG: DUF1349 domain-containing protein [Ardenticatenaceae bacterium]|nr:DUF1349 domain-containing protein [Anaerolineales bacterium]MCB8982883.1 DUF1349 domain-containing protein [Ardenticatenaceae bacterium]MCB8986341.1 DUF1349 domain-containing protein [Ardenticatenaceae bacterium]
MERLETFSGPGIPAGFYWFNPPDTYYFGSGAEIVTNPETDFWQTTHYGFQRDDGHCLFTRITGDFTLTTHVTFKPHSQYDQCGLMVRVNAENWIKMGIEYEDTAVSRLGSVVTNLGYSDWATQDITSDVNERWYRLHRNGNDFLLEQSADGERWQQMRVTHLHAGAPQLEVGVYACSPIGQDFWCRFTKVEITPNLWRLPT